MSGPVPDRLISSAALIAWLDGKIAALDRKLCVASMTPAERADRRQVLNAMRGEIAAGIVGDAPGDQPHEQPNEKGPA